MFATDRASLDALSSRIFNQQHSIDVAFEDGEVIASGLTTCAAVFEAVSATSDPVLLRLRRDGATYGVFCVLLQDDPDCLVVDHSDNLLCNHIFDEWFDLADAPVVAQLGGAS